MYRKVSDFIHEWQHESDATLKCLKNISNVALSMKDHENVRSMAVLTWIYFKLRDSMWGVFGSRKSTARVATFASMMAVFTFVFTLIFLAIEEWNLNAADFWALRAAMAALGISIIAPTSRSSLKGLPSSRVRHSA